MFKFLLYPKETKLETMDRVRSWVVVTRSFWNVLISFKALAHCLVALGIIIFIKLSSI